MVPVLKPPSVQDGGKCAAAAGTTMPALYQPATVAYQQMALAGMQLQQPAAYVPITSQ